MGKVSGTCHDVLSHPPSSLVTSLTDFLGGLPRLPSLWSTPRQFTTACSAAVELHLSQRREDELTHATGDFLALRHHLDRLEGEFTPTLKLRVGVRFSLRQHPTLSEHEESHLRSERRGRGEVGGESALNVWGGVDVRVL